MPDEGSATKPFVRLARYGVAGWNSWLKRQIDVYGFEASKPVVQALSGVAPLHDDDAKVIAALLKIPALPELPDRKTSDTNSVTFERTDFVGKPVNFAGFVFPDQTSFKNAKFGPHTDFSGATFGNDVRFIAATFGMDANFKYTRFGKGCRFDGALFHDRPRFDLATFGENCRFSGTCFGRNAYFGKAVFDPNVDFTGATFGTHPKFDGAIFRGLVSFDGLTNNELVELVKEWQLVTEYIQAIQPNEFAWVSFAGAEFHGICRFTGRALNGSLVLRGAVFRDIPEFGQTKEHGFIDPHGMSVTFPHYLWPFANEHVNSQTTGRIRRLRKIMADIHAQDVERDLFILERQAERAIAWNDLEKWAWRNPFQVLRAVGFTALLAAYQVLSDFGRSIVLPLTWLALSVTLFHTTIWYIWGKPIRSLNLLDRDLVAYSLGNLLPFVSTLSPSRGETLKRLFCPTDIQGICIPANLRNIGATTLGDILVPLRVEALALLEGVANAVLLFLLLQAVRNYFKMK